MSELSTAAFPLLADSNHGLTTLFVLSPNVVLVRTSTPPTPSVGALFASTRLTKVSAWVLVEASVLALKVDVVRTVWTSRVDSRW